MRSNTWLFFQHLQLDQPHPMGTQWTSVMTTRPTATVAQVMTSSSQVQSPPSSHHCALSVCVLCMCACHSRWWVAECWQGPWRMEPCHPMSGFISSYHSCKEITPSSCICFQSWVCGVHLQVAPPTVACTPPTPNHTL